jgi:uncharacterized protein YxeA
MKEKMKRMINMAKIRIGVIALLIMALLLAAVFFYYATGLINDSQNSYVRKEDIYASQKTIEQSLYDLNQSIQIELEYQKVLASKVTELSAKADLPAPIINTTKVVQAPPVVVKVPSTTPAPVTRAS